MLFCGSRNTESCDYPGARHPSKATHFKDFTFRRDPQIKKSVTDWVNLRDGDLDWKAIHKALAEIKYKGDATVELSGGDATYLKDLSKRVDLILEGA